MLSGLRIGIKMDFPSFCVLFETDQLAEILETRGGLLKVRICDSGRILEVSASEVWQIT
jgi:hypothetical protein